MQVEIDGRNFMVTPDIKKNINEGAVKFEKFLHNIIKAHFILKVEKYRKIVEIVVFVKHTVLKCKEVSEDMHVSIERALRNMEHQLRQHKEKIKAHHSKHSKEIEE